MVIFYSYWGYKVFKRHKAEVLCDGCRRSLVALLSADGGPLAELQRRISGKERGAPTPPKWQLARFSFNNLKLPGRRSFLVKEREDIRTMREVVSLSEDYFLVKTSCLHHLSVKNVENGSKVSNDHLSWRGNADVMLWKILLTLFT